MVANDAKMLSDANYPNGDLSKSLLEAARRGDENEVRTLLTKGASFTTDWLGTSPLHFAAQYGHLKTALLLMRAGMSWDARTKVNKTPLHIATQYGHEDLVKAFLAQGADVNAQDLILMTPLHWAAQKNYPAIAEILLQSGADIASNNKFDKTPCDICIENGFDEVLDKIKSHTECRSPASLYLEENGGSNTSDSEKVTDAPSPINLLSSLSSLAGISQDMLPSATVSMDEIALLQSTPINFSAIPLDSIRSIVLTDAGRLALQFLNKGLDNTILQSCSGKEDNVEDGRTCKVVSYKDDMSNLEQNPEQYLTTSSQMTTSNSKSHKFSRSKETMATSDLLPSTSSGISLPPVFPDWNLRNNGDHSDNFELDLDTVLLHKQLDGSRPSNDIGENLSVRPTSNGLQLALSEGVCKKL